jgi:hydroxymethylglutaryl-CoA lyase
MIKNASIIEVCPRDGLQNLEAYVPTKNKLELINLLASANIKKIQVTSFVNPKAVPQMNDAGEIVKIVLKKYPEVQFTALVPNLRGAALAYEVGIREISYVISASEAHNLANVRRTIEQSFEDLKAIKKEFKELKIKVDIATAFGCPFDGEVPVNKVLDMIDQAIKVDVDQIFLADTIGVANPEQMSKVLDAVVEKYPNVALGLHLHDTQGMGLANVLIAIQKGFGIFESAAGGLGGCPFAPGAAGNIATEDLVNMLEKMGINTDIDLDKLMKSVQYIKENIKENLSGHLANISRLK